LIKIVPALRNGSEAAAWHALVARPQGEPGRVQPDDVPTGALSDTGPVRFSTAVKVAGYSHHSDLRDGEILEELPYYGEILSRYTAPVRSASAPEWERDHGRLANPTVHIGLNQLRKLASELSYVTGGVVVALGAERGAVVRLIAFERGQMMDEYLSVPEFYGALPPGDAMALRANPTLLARLTGAEPAAIRAVARTADSPAELPPPEEQFAQLAEVLGIVGAGLGLDEAERLEGAVTVPHA